METTIEWFLRFISRLLRQSSAEPLLSCSHVVLFCPPRILYTTAVSDSDMQKYRMKVSAHMILILQLTGITATRPHHDTRWTHHRCKKKLGTHKCLGCMLQQLVMRRVELSRLSSRVASLAQSSRVSAVEINFRIHLSLDNRVESSRVESSQVVLRLRPYTGFAYGRALKLTLSVAR